VRSRIEPALGGLVDARRRAAAESGYHVCTVQNEYTAIIKRDGEWWIGWIEEIPGVNSQGATREELVENLASALREMLELNREDARKAADEGFEEIRISA
jgi:predicted RNase H-like HicB family nuclease